jgi:uncharacterized protein YndB with AHSA1/START domain/predicted enzyme related to lactoylglutathione lyase
MSSTGTAVAAFTITRTFDAPRERVFAAFTDHNLMRKWFGPPGTAVHDVTCDAREGGRYRIAMTSSEGEAFNVGGTFTEFRPVERLAYTFRWEEDAPELERDTYVSIDFIDLGGRTEMRFRQENFSDDRSRSAHESGWTDTFEQLAALLAPKRPFAIKGIDLSGYMCKDAARAIAFYRDVLGLEPSMIYPDDRGAEFDLPDGTTFGLWGGGGKVMPFQPSNGILFAVDDLDVAVETMRARGITVEYQTETPSCFIAMFPDSEGNKVFLHQRKAR